VLELKAPANKSVKAAKEALAAAREQLRQRDYAAALRERGAGEIAQWGIVFDGKKVWIERVE